MGCLSRAMEIMLPAHAGIFAPHLRFAAKTKLALSARSVVFAGAALRGQGQRKISNACSGNDFKFRICIHEVTGCALNDQAWSSVTILEKSATSWKRVEISRSRERRLKRIFSSSAITRTVSKNASTGSRSFAISTRADE